MAGRQRPLDFAALVGAIRHIHEQMAAQAGRAVNISLTLRNWAIGCYIREYEQEGADRARYGETLLEALSDELARTGVASVAARSLRLYRQFYVTYPQIRQTVSAESLPGLAGQIRQSLPAESAKVVPDPAAPATISTELTLPGQALLERLAFSHFAELVAIDDPLKRAFYEIECMRGNWSVRALKRQIASLYYERSGLSQNKERLAGLVKSGVEKAEPSLAVRDPYVFEFLGIKPREVMAESDLEDALLDKLQDFLLELGHGFCFEARQKSILIGETHGFVDLVFYHRLLKCHVLVELKVDEFTHQHLGQINSYVSWYRKNVMASGDNPPVGILLCTQKDHALVEYALAGMENHLFVSKYQLELPKKEEIQRFLEEKMREVGDAR